VNTGNPSPGTRSRAKAAEEDYAERYYRTITIC